MKINSDKRKELIRRNEFENEDYQNRFSQLLFLPHSEIWSLIVVINITLQVSLVLFCFGFKVKWTDNILYVYYSFETVYLIEIISIILHRNLSSHKNDVCLKRIPFLIYLAGIITLIPAYEAYVYLLNRKMVDVLDTVFKAKVLLRLFHVIHFFYVKRREAGVNQIIVIFFHHLFSLLISTMIISSIWGHYGCYQCGYKNWMDNLRDFVFSSQTPFDKFIYSFTYIGGLLLGNYGGLIKPENGNEAVIILSVLSISYLLQVMIFLGQITAQYVTIHTKQNIFNRRMENLKAYLNGQILGKQLIEDINMYYNTLWLRRRAIPKMPRCFELLPLTLQKEVVLDIFWESFKHSHIFRDLDMTFKNELSLIMTTEFLLAGDVLFNTNTWKNKFVYIVSGIVQILSDEDDESPILSFSGGTVLSEMNCLFNIRSICKLRCATLCEFQTLSMPNFFRKLLRFRHYTRSFRLTLKKRFYLAKKLHKRKNEDASQMQHEQRPIRRLKNNWRLLQQGTKTSSVISPSHTSKYLDLLVLSDAMELKVEVICLTSKFPFILDPNSSFRKFCDMVCLGAVIAQFFIVPYLAAFKRSITNPMKTVCLMLDFIYFFDLSLQATTAIKVKNKIIAGFGQILSNRLKQFSFLLDLVAIFPLDYAVFLFGSNDHICILAKLPRVIKIYKVVELIIFYEKKLGQNVIFIMYVKYICIYTITIYLLVCLFYSVSCFNVECQPYSWYIYNEKLSSWKYNIQNINPFIRTLLPVTSLIFGCGSGNIHGYTILDNLVMLAITLIGYYLFVFCLAEFTAGEYWRPQQESIHKMVITIIIKFIHIHKMSNDIMNHIKRLLIFRWEHTKDMVKCDAFDVFHDAPNSLKKKLRYELIQKYLECTTFFQNMSYETVKRVAKISMLIAVPSQGHIIHANRDINYIYVIKRGYCRATSKVPGDHERQTAITLKYPGDCFPVMEVMHRIESFSTVIAITTVEIIVIPYEILINILKMDLWFYENLQDALELHMRENSSILKRKECKLDISPGVRTKEYGEAFTYQLPTFEKTKTKEYVITKNLEKIIKITFSPLNKFFIAWEVLRCILTLIQVGLIFLFNSYLHNRRKLFNLLITLIDVTIYMDIFIKSRLTYFKENGILVQNYLMTTFNYLKSGFLLDIFSAAPLAGQILMSINITSENLSIQILTLLFTRSFQLIRIFYGVSYLCNRYKLLSEINLVRVKCVVILIFVIMASSIVIFCYVCVNSDTGFYCPDALWTATGLIKKDRKTEYMLDIFLHFGCECLYRSFCGIYPDSLILTNILYNFYFGVMCIFIIILLVISSKLTSSGLHSEYTSQLQNDRRNFKQFCSQEAMDYKLMSNTLSTNEYLTKDIEASTFEIADSTFTPQILEDVSYTFNSNALKNSPILAGAPQSFIRYISTKMSTKFFKKDGFIIRLNDVHNYLYIVKKGKVEVRMANTRLAILNSGGMFGCFTNKGHFRQTVTFQAVYHTQVLVMNSTKFHWCCSKVPNIKTKLDKFVRTNPEYAESLTKTDDYYSHTTTSSSEHASTNRSISINNYCEKYYSFVNKIFNRNSIQFKILIYLLNVHLSAISVIYVLFYQLIAMYIKVGEMNILLYALDIIFLIRIFLGFTLRYVDEESGVTIYDKRKIVKQYLKKNFALDLITILTPELWCSFSFKGFYLSLFASNRLLRFIFLWRYYNSQKKNNKLAHHLRWTFLLYILIIYIQLTTNIWNYFSCYSYKTCLIASDLSHRPLVLVKTNETLFSVVTAYNYLLGIYSSTGMRMVYPQTVVEMRVSYLITCTSIFMFTYICSGFAIIQIIDTFSLGRYNYDVAEIKTYLHYQKLSPAIFTKVTDYLFYLWKVQNGEQIPALVTNSNDYLKQDIMYDVYGHHLLNHQLFKNTHVDFLRQVMMHLKRSVFPKGYVIIEEGDVDYSMYFIHTGIVDAVLRDGFSVKRITSFVVYSYYFPFNSNI